MRKKQFLLVAGQAIGQVAFLAALPILTRIYTPAELGAYQLALAIGLLAQPLATLRIEMVIPSLTAPSEVRRLRRIAAFGIAIVTCCLLLSGLISWVASGPAAAFGASALILLAYTSMAIDNAMLIRAKLLNRLIVRNSLSGLLSALIQVLLSLVWVDAYALAAGVLIGRGVAILVTSRPVRTAPSNDEATDLDANRWNVRRGLMSTGAALIAAGNAQALRVFTAIGHGPSAVGEVGVAQQAASAPLALVSQGLAQFTQAELAPLVRDGNRNMSRAVRRQILLVLPFAVAITAALGILGPVLAGPIFGEAWAGAGAIIAILAVPSGLQLLTAPLMAVFVMLTLERYQLRLQILRLVLVAIGVTCGVLFAGHDIRFVVAGYSVGNSLGYLIILTTLLRLVSERDD